MALKFEIKKQNVSVKVDLRGVDGVRKSIDRAFNHSERNALHRAMLQWCIIYRAWAQERYDTFSKGGGDWPPLKEATKKRRRKGAGGGEPSILRDTNTMFQVLDAVFRQQAGAIQEPIKGGFEVGFGGSAKHPTGKTTVADIAEYHHTGAGNLPVREVISAELPSNVIARMERITNEAIRKLIDANSI